MSARERRHQGIADALQATGTATVSELGQRLGVAEMTIRRDLEVLEAEGVLKRFHGGARLAFGSSYEPPFSLRERNNQDQKQAIGRQAASLINDGETVILDGGSTGLAVAEALEHRQITVCALSLRVAWTLAKFSSINLLMPPGSVRQGELSVSGADTIDYLRGLHFDAYIMTASAVTVAEGFSEWNVADSAVKKTALKAAHKTIACVDSSKFGRTAFAKVCPVSTPTVIVTDPGLSVNIRDEAKSVARSIVFAD